MSKMTVKMAESTLGVQYVAAAGVLSFLADTGQVDREKLELIDDNGRKIAGKAPLVYDVPENGEFFLAPEGRYDARMFAEKVGSSSRATANQLFNYLRLTGQGTWESKRPTVNGIEITAGRASWWITVPAGFTFRLIPVPAVTVVEVEVPAQELVEA